MQRIKQDAEGKYYCKSEFKTYKDMTIPHCERGLAEIIWEPETKKYQVMLINLKGTLTRYWQQFLLKDILKLRVTERL